MIGLIAFSGAHEGMANPQGYSFLMSLILCVMLSFILLLPLTGLFGEKNGAFVTLGVMIGGLIFGWLFGKFNNEFGLASSLGYSLGLFGLGWMILRGNRDNG